MRQQVDADAERLDLGRGLEDAAGDAGLVQRQREREPADAAADDQDGFAPGPRIACAILKRASSEFLYRR